MIWKGLVAYTGSESPVVVVLSGSMEPTFYKGDILSIAIPNEPYQIGDIVVFKIPGKEIPIVHRILELHTDSKTGEQRILTKGDNNDSFDRPLYSGAAWIKPDQILGKAKFILPSLGHITILLTEYPMVKYAMLALMGWFVLTAKE
jgi:signal peptidase